MDGLRVARVLVWAVRAVVLAAVVILVLTFFLLLFNASTAAEFTQWVYRSADRVLQPFRGIFPTAALGDRGSVVDFAVLFAIIVYTLLGEAVGALVAWLDRTTAEQQAAAQRARYEAALRGVARPGEVPAPRAAAPGATWQRHDVEVGGETRPRTDR